jgi:8-oxo-dGTP pyrophosphatase MutT (NUDIX family)
VAATPKPSATVVLARDSERGPEILLVKRRAGDAFGDSYTFPGGVLDDDEGAARNYCAGLSADEADAVLGVTDRGLDYYSAVVRELYEETGILLGAGEAVDGRYRDQLHSGTLAWAEFLRQQGLSIPCDTLHYFTHWITPSALPKRWTTRFFLAAMPGGQDVLPDGNEITDYCWLTATDALDSAERGEREIPYPTRKTLETFVGKKTVAALMDWARQRQKEGIPAIQPEIRADDGKRRIFMPEIGE